jgi:hypothetical protein
MQPRARRQLVADHGPHPGGAGLAAFAVGWVLIFFGIMRELSASVLL